MGREQAVKTQLLVRLREAIINFSGPIEGLSPAKLLCKRHSLLVQVELDIDTFKKNCVSIHGQWRVLRALRFAGLQIEEGWSPDYSLRDTEIVFGHITVSDAEAFLKAQLSTVCSVTTVVPRASPTVMVSQKAAPPHDSPVQLKKERKQDLSGHDQEQQNGEALLSPGTVVVSLDNDNIANSECGIQRQKTLLTDLALKFCNKDCDEWGIAFGFHCFARRKTPRHIAAVRQVLVRYGIYLDGQDPDKVKVSFAAQLDSKLASCLDEIQDIMQDALPVNDKPSKRDWRTHTLYIETRQSLVALYIMGNKAQDDEPHFSNPFQS